uniref:Uncharacterized protein n=1 Tax=viral metagenome TaxID=1070528 RepID=A0A6M3M4U6_9ZZZZ
MSEYMFNTVIDLPPGFDRDEGNALLNKIGDGDETFIWRFRDDNTLLILSKHRSQAESRARWLTGKTETFEGLKYHITVNPNTKRPETSISLQELEKRKKQFGQTP